MSPSTVVVLSIPVFMLIMFIPGFVLMSLSRFCKIRLYTGKMALLIFVCIICYYTVVLSQMRKITVPYYQKHSVEVQVCETKRVLKD